MTRQIIITLVVLAVVGIAGAYFLMQPPAPTTPAQQQTQTDTPNDSTNTTSQPSVTTPQPSTTEVNTVQSAFQSALPLGNPDHIKLYETAIVSGYAIQSWKGDTMGGEALLKYDAAARQWVVITHGGGAWSVDGLVGAGVPRDTATALLKNIPL